jgi:hypothetical protein
MLCEVARLLVVDNSKRQRRGLFFVFVSTFELRHSNLIRRSDFVIRVLAMSILLESGYTGMVL